MSERSITYDLSLPKPVAPDFITVQHLKHDNKVSIKWRMNPELNIMGYNIFRGRTPQGPWNQINKTLISSLEYFDVIPRDYNINSYYCVQAVNDQFVMSDLSLPERVQVLLEKIEHIDRAVMEIRRRNELTINFRGEECDLYQKMYEGVRCQCATGSEFKPVAKDGCPICYGTSYVGGYYPPQRIKVSIELAQIKQTIEKYGLTVSDTPKGWTLWEPIIHDRDVLVMDDNVRYVVLSVKLAQGKGREVTHQNFDLQKLDPSDAMYALSRPSMEAVTAATLMEEQTGLKSIDNGIFQGDFGTADKTGGVVVGGKDADGNATEGFIYHSPKDNNIFTRDASIERGRKGYGAGLRLNLGQWSGYITNKLGSVQNQSDKIQLYAVDSNLKAISRPNTSWVFTEGKFDMPSNAPMEYSVQMDLGGSGYFYYESLGMLDVNAFTERQFADRFWFQKVNNIHFGLGTGDIWGNKVRAFIYFNDDIVIQKSVDNFVFTDKHWVKMTYDGTEFKFFIDNVLAASYSPERQFKDFKFVMGAGAWAGDNIGEVKPKLTNSYVNVYSYKSNMPTPVVLYKPEMSRHTMDSHVSGGIGLYDVPSTVAMLSDNFTKHELDSSLWQVYHKAKGINVYPRNNKLFFSGISMYDLGNRNPTVYSGLDLLGSFSAQSLLYDKKCNENESYVLFKAQYDYVSKMQIDVKVVAGGREDSHSIVTITNVKNNATAYCSYGVFFNDSTMVGAGFCVNDAWRAIPLSNKLGNDVLVPIKIIYDFKSSHTEYYVNNELLFTENVMAFHQPFVVLSAGNTKKGLNLMNAFSNFKVTYNYIDRDVDALDFEPVRELEP